VPSKKGKGVLDLLQYALHSIHLLINQTSAEDMSEDLPYSDPGDGGSIEKYGESVVRHARRILQSVKRFLERAAELSGERDLMKAVLYSLYQPLQVWLKEPRPRGTLLTPGDSDKLGSAFEECWKSLLAYVKTSGYPFNQELLNILSPLMETSLSSGVRWMKNSAVTFWKETFANNDSLVCSPTLSSTLAQLARYCDVKAPSQMTSYGGASVVGLLIICVCHYIRLRSPFLVAFWHCWQPGP